MLELKTRENESHLEITLAGALTLREVKDAFEFVNPLWRRGKAMILNLGGVTDIDTMGYQLLLHWKIRAKAEHLKMHFVNHSTPVLGALDLFGGVAEMGDKIKLSADDRKRFAFAYGTKRH